MVGGSELDLSDCDDLVALAQAASLPLMKKAISLAVKSNNLNEVMGVLRLLSERGYGKPGKAADAATPVDAMSRVWEVLDGVEAD